MIDWLRTLNPAQFVLLVIGVFFVLALVSALVTWILVRRGLRTPWAVRRMNRVTIWVVDLIKRPITVAVLDEVSEVLQSGHYTKNISEALVENHDELVALVAEKVRNDPATRVVSHLPGYDTVVHQVSETTLRVLIEMLGDPRMDELISDLIRNNLQQIKQAVREHEPGKAPPPPTARHPARHLPDERPAPGEVAVSRAREFSRCGVPRLSDRFGPVSTAGPRPKENPVHTTFATMGTHTVTFAKQYREGELRAMRWRRPGRGRATETIEVPNRSAACRGPVLGTTSRTRGGACLTTPSRGPT